MTKKIVPFLLLFLTIFLTTFLWDKILLTSNNSQIYGVYKENNYHPINEIYRFILYISLPIIIFFKSFYTNNKKKCYSVNSIFFDKLGRIKYSKNNLSFYILVSLLFLILFEFLSIDFISLHKDVDHFHDGVYLSASNNFFLKDGFWSSSFVEYGLINFDSIFIWSILNVKSIGSAKLLKYIYLFFNKGILILIFYNLSQLFFTNKSLQSLFFLLVSLFSITFIDYIQFEASEFPLRILILLFFNYLFLKILTEGSDKFILQFMLGLLSASSILWTLDMGIFINFLLILILFFFIIRKDFTKIKFITFGIIFGWISLTYLLGYKEIVYLFDTFYLMITNVDQASGLIYPTPFLSGEARFTKALLFYIFNGVLLIIICFHKDFIIPNSLKIFLASFYLSSILVFKQALTRSDTAHIKAASGISYVITISIVLYLILSYLKNNNYFSKFIKKISQKNYFYFLTFIGIFIYSLFFFEINFKNIYSFKQNIQSYTNQENNKFLDKDTINLVNYYKKISKNDKCIQNITNQSTLPFLINKPSCTRYFTNWYIVTNEHQKRFINELKNKKPRLILYWSKLDVYNFDDYKRFPLVNTYLKNNYKTYNKNENWHFLERK